jgi:hypothetical protein
MRLSSRQVTCAVAAVLLAITGAVLAVVVNVRGGKASVAPDQLTLEVRQAVTLKARDVIEGGASSALGSDLACAVEPLGTAPTATAPTARVQTAYVWAVCGSISEPSEIALPVAVHFTQPPTVEVPRDGARNGPDPERTFPRRLWDLAFDGPANTDSLVADMKQRRETLREQR